FRAIAGVFSGDNYSDRDFFQVFFDGQKIPTGVDSTQEQVTRLYNRNFSLRLSYDKSVDSARWQFSTGINVFSNNSDNHLKTRFLKKPENYFVESGPLSNDFGFHQRIYAARFSVRYRLQRDWHITSGIQAEQTRTWFNNEELAGNYDNRYISWLPFTNTVWKPDTRYTVSFSYRKSIQRPGVNALNPAIDYSDPYNTRFGNPYLKPSFSHNFDWVLNRWHKDYFWNISAGYNKLSELFNALRELLPDGRTQITWKNISSRQEYEISAWGGITYAKNSRINISAGYVYNTYSENDKRLLKYRDGGSFTSGINGTYSLGAYWQFSGIFTYNRFANPQGTVRSNLNLNLGAQRKLVKNRLVVSLNIIDPFSGQVTRTASFGTNFQVESSSFTQTRNIKLGISYNFIKPPSAKKPVAKKPVAAKPAK
ncbi:MAG: TonB-dependent receptor family protein, partial [Dinghuibacter sp.]|nr:TonB-dependent receptor family protein [Dinghuibacter sp.]